jgi:hypothetical protein
MLSKIYQVGSPLKSIISLSSGIEIEWKKSKIDKNGSYKNIAMLKFHINASHSLI